MLQCDSCETWYHASCLKISESTLTQLDTFICFACEKSEESTESSGSPTEPGFQASKLCKNPSCKKNKSSNSSYCSPECLHDYISKFVKEKVLNKINPVETLEAKEKSVDRSIKSNQTDRNSLQILYLKKEKLSTNLANLLNKRENFLTEIRKIFSEEDKVIGLENLNISDQNEAKVGQVNSEKTSFCSICCQRVLSSKLQQHIRRCAIKKNTVYQIPYEVSALSNSLDGSEEITIQDIYCSHSVSKHNQNLKCKTLPLICGHHQPELFQRDSSELSPKRYYCLYPFKYDSFMRDSLKKCTNSRLMCDTHFDWENVIYAQFNLEIANILEKREVLNNKVSVIEENLHKRHDEQKMFQKIGFKSTNV